jgi:hypothetical protein
MEAVRIREPTKDRVEQTGCDDPIEVQPGEAFDTPYYLREACVQRERLLNPWHSLSSAFNHQNLLSLYMATRIAVKGLNFLSMTLDKPDSISYT